MAFEINYITPQGYQKLLDERDFLVKKERPKITELVTWAAGLGDRSENADYQYGKKRLREIDRRLRFLNKRLNCAQVVDPLEQSGQRVAFGATVKVENEDGLEKIYCIVGVDEIDLKRNLISWRSPIGKALIGRSLGDSVEVVTPIGLVELEIIAISFVEILTIPFEEEM